MSRFVSRATEKAGALIDSAAFEAEEEGSGGLVSDLKTMAKNKFKDKVKEKASELTEKMAIAGDYYLL